jgi:uncharacterized protein YcnI
MSMIRKSFVASVVFATALLALPTIAGAHTEIEADDAPANGVVATTIAAENECKAKIQSVELVFPESPELTTATAGPVDGWTAVVTKRTGSEAVDKVVWTNSGQVDGGGTFPLTLGTIPDGTKTVDFKAIDTCDDGEVFRWVQAGESSEFPAPVLALKTTGSSGAATTTTTKAADSKSDDDSNTGLIVGIIAAVVVVGGGAAYFLTRKKSTT